MERETLPFMHKFKRQTMIAVDDLLRISTVCSLVLEIQLSSALRHCHTVCLS